MAKPAVFDADKKRAEAQRRAKILRRYVAIEAPTLDDDERFAAELGLAKDTLYQLARSWRLHADPSLLSGSFTRTASADREAAYKATVDPDLSGVLPTRRATIAARITELRAFLLINGPSRNDEMAAAKRLGMNLGAFRRLHRSWMLARDPVALPGASLPARMPQRRRPKVPPQVERIIAEAIARSGPGAKALAIHREVCALCDAAGLPRPSRATVHQRFVDARARMPLTDMAPSLAVDHVALEIPVRSKRLLQFPVLSAIIDLPSGQILLHELSLQAPTAKRTAALIGRLLCNAERDGNLVPLRVNVPAGDDWKALLAVLATHRVDTTRAPNRSLRPGATLMRVFGDRLGRFKLRPGLTTSPESARPRIAGGASSPLTIDEARAVVSEAIEANNAGRSPAGTHGFIEAGGAIALARSLDAMA